MTERVMRRKIEKTHEIYKPQKICLCANEKHNFLLNLHTVFIMILLSVTVSDAHDTCNIGTCARMIRMTLHADLIMRLNLKRLKHS